MKKKLIALLSSIALLATATQGMLSANAEGFHEYRAIGYGICSHDIAYSLWWGDIDPGDVEVPPGEVWLGNRMMDVMRRHPTVRMALYILLDDYYAENGIEEEVERLRSLGFDAVAKESWHYIRLIATVEQMQNFPASEDLGYRIGLATYSEEVEKKFEKMLESDEPTTEPTPVVKGLSGDADNDGEIGVMDIVVLQKWLLGIGELPNWKNADLCEDGIINIYDLLKLKQLLIAS